MTDYDKYMIEINFDTYIRNIRWLNQRTKEYDEGHPTVSDKEWDDKYFEVQAWENEHPTMINPESPTQKITSVPIVVSELKKVKHNHPMLSLAKTKDVEEVEKFIGDKDYIVMAKMDGLTCSLHYEGGKLVSAETRGNGEVGEDITHNAMVIPSIPKRINNEGSLTVDGEIICTYNDFKPFANEYKNPRNFASGSIRLLDSKECAKRNLTFVAWDLIEPSDQVPNFERLSDKLCVLEDLNFLTVPCILPEVCLVTKTPLEMIEYIKNASIEEQYPIDGAVIKYDYIKDYDAAGRTDHHFKGGLAYKFYDEEYETTLKDIEWSMGRTGVLTPVAIFEPIEIDGTTIERASLHNVSVLMEILGDCPYINEYLTVAKMNMIIPQITSAHPKYDFVEEVVEIGMKPLYIPDRCPCCGEKIELIKSDSEVLNAVCTNPQCEGKLINKLDHFCGKKGLDIKGLSEKTLEKLIDWEWVNDITDIPKLKEHRSEWISKPGFGQASVDKILKAIDDRLAEAPLSAFISGLGIPLVGTRVAKQICEYVETWAEFKELIEDIDFTFEKWNGFGYEMNKALKEFDYSKADAIVDFITFKIEEHQDNSVKLDNKIFVITGKLKNFKNRDELVSVIENAGGKVASSVTSKTNYLINDDITSTSAKNKKAKELNIPIITEEDLMEMIK